MKRFSVLLICCAFLLTGCREEYLSEKAFYEAKKELGTVTRSRVKAEGPEVYNASIEKFAQVNKRYPKTAKAAESLFMVAKLRLRQDKFDEAREALREIVLNYSGKQVAEARYQIARALEFEGKWPEAEKAYWELAEYESLELQGLFAPVHILNIYKKKGLPNLEGVFAKVLEHYQKLLDQTGPIQASVSIRNYISVAYVIHGEWEKARQNWIQIVSDFPKNAFAPMALLAAGEVSHRNMDLEAAVELYTRYLERHKDHHLVGQAHIRLAKIYHYKKEYAPEREWLEKAAAWFEAKGRKDEILPALRLAIGKSYQDEGNWEKAQENYSRLVSEAPGSNAAMQVPFLEVHHYETAGDAAKAKEVLNAAITRFEALARENKGETAVLAKKFRNTATAQAGDWTQVLEYLEEDTQAETDSVRKGQWLLMQALITENRLADKVKARELYQSFLKDYSDHPLADIAKSHLKVLEAV